MHGITVACIIHNHSYIGINTVLRQQYIGPVDVSMYLVDHALDLIIKHGADHLSIMKLTLQDASV